MNEHPSDRTRVAVLDDYQGIAAKLGDWHLLPLADVEFFHDHLTDPEVIIDRLSGFDVIVAMRERTPLPGSILRRLDRVRLIVSTGMVNPAIDVVGARENGILVCGTDGARNGVFELTWGLILTLARRIGEHDRETRAGRWQTGELGVDLEGATLGVVGLGNHGQSVATAAHAFRMKVVAWSPNLTESRALAGGAKLVTKKELFERADFVTIHMVLSESTHGLISRTEFRAMKPTAYFINTSRGPLIDETALAEALREGWIAGAALDVFDTEPLPPSHPFLSLSNIILTPHVGFNTVSCYEVMFDHIVEDIRAYLQGDPIRVLS